MPCSLSNLHIYDIKKRPASVNSNSNEAIQLLFIGITVNTVPSVLCRCWLGGRKGIQPVKTEWWGAVCLERGADLHMAQLMPLPLTVSCFTKIQIGFTFVVPAHLGSPDKGPLNRCVRVCVCVLCVC